MENRKFKAGIPAIVMSAAMFFFAACNNSDYTKNPDTSSPSSDTAMNNSTAGTDTGSAMSAKTTTAGKKKGKVSVGTMDSKGTMKADKNGVYERAEVSPAYPGGQSALDDYINNNIEYPQSAIDNNSEGTVNVEFVVSENGNVANAKIIGKQLGNDLDAQAVKVVSNMPKWEPGKVKGKNVKTKIILPITFKMEE